MVQCAADHGLRVPKSETIQDICELEDAVSKIDSWPLVIKPSASAGTDHVVIAKTNTELLETAKKILNQTNQLGLINKKAILQEYICGTEFSVNAVSYEGVIKFTHIWKYHKKEVVAGKFAYDWEYIVDPESDEAKDIFSYMNRLLPAVGVIKGPSHSVVKIDDKGVCLIETAARLDGTLSEQSDLLSVGHTQVELTISGEVNGAEFQEKYPDIYNKKLHAANVYLISDKSGQVTSESVVETIKSHCPSYLGARIQIKKGDNIRPTTDLFSTPGIIFLVSDCFEQLQKDYRVIRKLEARGQLYRVSEDESEDMKAEARLTISEGT